MPTITAFTAIVLYLSCFVLLLTQTKNKTLPAKPLFFGLFFAALLSHIIFLHHTLFANQALHISFFAAGSLISFAIGVITISTLIRKLPVENLMLAYLPLSALSILLDWAIPNQNPVINGQGLISHIVLSILSYSFITLAALQACMLAIQEHQLRQHHFTGIFQYLPPMQAMENLLFEMIWLGFISLSVAIGTGFLFLHDMFAQHLAHKTILSMLAWAVFAALLFGRHQWGWRGKTATKWTLAGFSMLMLAYFGSKFVLEFVLQQTWTS